MLMPASQPTWSTSPCGQMAMEEKLASLRKQEVGALRHAMSSWSFWLVGGHLWPVGTDV